MHEPDLQRIAENWVKLYKLPNDSSERGSLFWAFERFDDLCRNYPEEAWQVINLVRKLDASEIILANLAAGPVEDLLVTHGEEFIDRIEELAATDHEFRKLLGAVWKNKIADDIWARLKAVAGPSF